jgi:hypothetical protein
MLWSTPKSRPKCRVGFAEWGPETWILLVGIPSEGLANGHFPRCRNRRAPDLQAVKDAKIYSERMQRRCREMMYEGVIGICSSGQAAAEKGRKFSKRPTPGEE